MVAQGRGQHVVVASMSGACCTDLLLLGSWPACGGGATCPALMLPREEEMGLHAAGVLVQSAPCAGLPPSLQRLTTTPRSNPRRICPAPWRSRGALPRPGCVCCCQGRAASLLPVHVQRAVNQASRHASVVDAYRLSLLFGESSALILSVPGQRAVFEQPGVQRAVCVSPDAVHAGWFLSTLDGNPGWAFSASCMSVFSLCRSCLTQTAHPPQPIEPLTCCLFATTVQGCRGHHLLPGPAGHRRRRQASPGVRPQWPDPAGGDGHEQEACGHSARSRPDSAGRLPQAW